MSSETIEVVPFDPAKNESILAAVHATHFTSRDSAMKRQSYVNWLLSNPSEGSIYLAAYVDGSFASFLGFMAREVVGFGRTFRGALAFGAMTLPEYGGRGLYRRLASAGWKEARSRGFHFAMGYTNRRYVLEMELRMGWSDMGTAPVMAFPLDIGHTLAAAVPQLKLLSALTAPLNWLAAGVARRLATRALITGYTFEPVQSFSDDYDNLTAQLRNAEQLTFAKDHRTLDWLYLSPANPFDYDVIEARQNGNLIGFVVGRRMDLMGLDGYGLLDIVALPGHEAVLSVMAARLVIHALSQRPQIIASLVSRGHPVQAALRSLGFIDTRRSFTLIFRPTQDNLPDVLSKPEHWSNFWGNNDTV